jgi:hypothetical protein
LDGIKTSRSAQAYDGSQLLSREPGVRRNQVVGKGNPGGKVLGTQIFEERKPWKAGNDEGA